MGVKIEIDLLESTTFRAQILSMIREQIVALGHTETMRQVRETLAPYLSDLVHEQWVLDTMRDTVRSQLTADFFKDYLARAFNAEAQTRVTTELERYAREKWLAFENRWTTDLKAQVHRCLRDLLAEQAQLNTHAMTQAVQEAAKVVLREDLVRSIVREELARTFSGMAQTATPAVPASVKTTSSKGG